MMLVFTHHENFPSSKEVKELPLRVPVATPTPVLVIKEDHPSNDQQHDEVLDERILAMTNQNTKKQHRDWFSGLAYYLKTTGSE